MIFTNIKYILEAIKRVSGCECWIYINKHAQREMLELALGVAVLVMVIACLFHHWQMKQELDRHTTNERRDLDRATNICFAAAQMRDPSEARVHLARALEILENIVSHASSRLRDQAEALQKSAQEQEAKLIRAIQSQGVRPALSIPPVSRTVLNETLQRADRTYQDALYKHNRSDDEGNDQADDQAYDQADEDFEGDNESHRPMSAVSVIYPNDSVSQIHHPTRNT